MVAAALLSSRAGQWLYYSPLYYYPLSKAGVALYSPLAHHSGNGSRNTIVLVVSHSRLIHDSAPF